MLASAVPTFDAFDSSHDGAITRADFQAGHLGCVRPYSFKVSCSRPLCWPCCERHRCSRSMVRPALQASVLLGVAGGWHRSRLVKPSLGENQSRRLCKTSVAQRATESPATFGSLQLAAGALLLVVAVWMSWLHPSAISACVCLALCAVLGFVAGEHTAFGRVLTGPVCAMALGFVAAQVVPRTQGQYVVRNVQRFAVGLATPLLLLPCDLWQILGSSRRLLSAFAIGALGTLLGVLLGVALWGTYLVELCGGPELMAGLAGAVAAKNVGSSLNYVGVARAAHLPHSLVSAGMVVDNLIGLIYYPLTSSVCPPGSPGVSAHAEQTKLASVGTTNQPSSSTALEGQHVSARFRRAAVAILLAISIAFTAEQLAPPGFGFVASSVASIAIATVGGPSLRRLAADGAKLSSPLLYMFFASVGLASGRVTEAALRGRHSQLFFLLTTYATHLAVLLSAGYLCRIPRAELMVASSANIGGPATASSLALARSRPDLARPALLVGTFGNAVGTPLGLAMYALLRWAHGAL